MSMMTKSFLKGMNLCKVEECGGHVTTYVTRLDGVEPCTKF